jgi:hypothetical protein
VVPPPAPPIDDDDLDLEVLQFVLLRRSEMHAVRLRRQIAAWSKDGHAGASEAPGDAILFGRGTVRQLLRYRFDLLVQFAIELILQRPQIANRLRDDAPFARLLYDALYYPMRQLTVAGVRPAATPAGAADVPTMLDLRDRMVFETYLIERMSSDSDTGSGAPAPAPPPDASSSVQDLDPAFLLAQVRDLAAMLADPFVLLDELAVARTNGFDLDSPAVLDALPLNPPTGPLLGRQPGTAHLYEWRYDDDWNFRGR